MLFVVFIVGEACTVGVYDSLLPLMLRGHRSEISPRSSYTFLAAPKHHWSHIEPKTTRDTPEDFHHSQMTAPFCHFCQRLPGEYLDFSTSSTNDVFTSIGSGVQAAMFKARALSDREFWNPPALDSAPPVSETVIFRDEFTPSSSQCRRGR